MRFGAFIGAIVVGWVAVVLAIVGGWGWWVLAGTCAFLWTVGVYDLTQREHAILRNYPILGHFRFLMEMVRPELQQYFIERNYDGRPYDRDTRTVIYQRAKGEHAGIGFGTERDVSEVGYEWLLHSNAPVAPPEEPPRVTVGGPGCTQPYKMALLNVSGMSFGALSGPALRALNQGAARGGFAHDTGEGGISKYHRSGGDLIWELGTGYYGCRTDDGGFAADEFADLAADPAVKCVELKLSQGAKPGVGGVLPGGKVTQEIADARDVPVGQTVTSPPSHRVFSTPRELVLFIAQMRELAGGKPAGFKLCLGMRHEFLAICKAMLAEDVTPDFIVVDGSEGGTGAAPQEFADHVGTPLTDGLMTVHNALVGCGLRDRIRIGASGKIATGSDVIKRLAQGADYCNAGRAMMMATGCIQSQRCHTNQCPVGVATQDPKRARALDVEDKTDRVFNYQTATVTESLRLAATMGLEDIRRVGPHQLMRRIDPITSRSYAELYTWLGDGQLVAECPEHWVNDWVAASPDTFAAT